MTNTRLAAALSLALLVVPVSQAARYRVVELPVVAEGKNSFPSSINLDGQITVNVNSPYHIPIDLDLLDFSSDTLVNNLTDIQSASNGDFNNDDYEIILSLLRSANGSQTSQQIANRISFLASEDETDYISGFDQLLKDDDNAYAISTTNVVRDINNSGIAVGSGEDFRNKVEYSLENGQDVTFMVNKFGNRAFASLNGKTIPLPPPETIVGGFSDAYGINSSNQVVGYGTTLFLTDSLETAEKNCEDVDSRGDVPYESCISTLAGTLTNALTNYARLRGLIWELDEQGNLKDTVELGLLFKPEADDTSNYTSQALAINDNGIAVGISNGLYTEDDNTFVRNYGVIFNKDEVINLTPDPDSLVARSSQTISSAAAINNDNLVVGYEYKRINGTNRSKFFVYDMDLGELKFPDDFFLGSSSVALDINNNGLVVGYGDIDASLTGRRTEGFLYDNNSDEFFRVGDLLSCDSPYTIVQANSINDNNEIAATALYKGPRRNSKGEIILDNTGGEIMVDLVAAVKLVPIPGGDIEDCKAPVDEINRDRQGASVSWILVLGFVLLGWRRFKRKS